MKKLAGVLAATVLTPGLTAADASARTQWYYERHPMHIGETREVQAHSNIFKLGIMVPPKHARTSLTCTVSGVEAFWDTPESGMDETKSIAFSCTASCGVVSVTPYLPWTSILEPGEKWPLPDKWSNVRLGIRCGSTNFGIFEGTLTPHSGDFDDQGTETVKSKDEPDSFLSFQTRSGELVSANRGKLRFVGFYKFGERKHEVVTAEL
jgi:hypothetical protein